MAHSADLVERLHDVFWITTFLVGDAQFVLDNLDVDACVEELPQTIYRGIDAPLVDGLREVFPVFAEFKMGRAFREAHNLAPSGIGTQNAIGLGRL